MKVKSKIVLSALALTAALTSFLGAAKTEVNTKNANGYEIAT